MTTRPGQTRRNSHALQRPRSQTIARSPSINAPSSAGAQPASNLKLKPVSSTGMVHANSIELGSEQDGDFEDVPLELQPETLTVPGLLSPRSDSTRTPTALFRRITSQGSVSDGTKFLRKSSVGTVNASHTQAEKQGGMGSFVGTASVPGGLNGNLQKQDSGVHPRHSHSATVLPSRGNVARSSDTTDDHSTQRILSFGSAFETVQLNSSTHTPYAHLSGGRLAEEIVEFTITRDGKAHLGVELAVVGSDIFVTCVWRHWPAYRAGLRFGDQVLRIDNIAVRGLPLKDVNVLLEAKPRVTIRVRSHPYETTVSMERRMEKGKLELLGLTFLAGVVIKVVPQTPADRAGRDLLNHIILAINGKPVLGLPDAHLVREFIASGAMVSISIMSLTQFRTLVATKEDLQRMTRSAILDYLIDQCVTKGLNVTSQPPPSIHVFSSC